MKDERAIGYQLSAGSFQPVERLPPSGLHALHPDSSSGGMMPARASMSGGRSTLTTPQTMS